MNIELKERSREDLLDIISAKDMKIVMQNIEIERLHSIIKEVREYIKENTQWYDKELGLVEMEGYKSNRIPVIYLYGLLEILKGKE